MHSTDWLAEAKRLLSYNPETGVFVWRENRRGRAFAGDEAGSVRADGYRRIGVACRTVWAHRLAWAFVHGAMPAHSIDHINGDPTDNRIANLRDVPARMNSENRRTAGPRRAGGTLIGAHWCKTWQRWKSAITAQGRPKHLGWFDTEEQAHAAYVAAKRELHAGCTI